MSSDGTNKFIERRTELNPNIRFFQTEIIFKEKISLNRNYCQELEQLGLPQDQAALLAKILRTKGVSEIYIKPRKGKSKDGVCEGGDSEETDEIAITKGEAFSWGMINLELRKIFQEQGLGVLVNDDPGQYTVPKTMDIRDSHATIIFSVNRVIVAGKITCWQGKWEEEPDIEARLGSVYSVVKESFETFDAGIVVVSSYSLLIVKGVDSDQQKIEKIKTMLEEILQAD